MIAYSQSTVKMQNKLQNQGSRLTVKAFPGSAWERIKLAKEAKQLSFVNFFLLSVVYCLLTQAEVQAERHQNLQNISVSPGFSPTPIRVQSVGGGSASLSQIAGRQETPNGPCVGFTDAKPNHNLVLNSSFNYLSIQVESREDTTLLVRGPGGIWCNDDFRGKNPGLAGQWLPGTYEIWIGCYGKDKQAPYTLRISEQR